MSPHQKSPHERGNMTTVAPRRGADVIVETLIAHGVTTLFGVPGDTGVVLYDALHAKTDQIEHVLARDERHALAELARDAVNACDLCDDNGYRGNRVCNHDTDTEARAARGLALVRAQLSGKAGEA